MTLRRRVISALVVFGIGGIAAMPFLKRQTTERTPEAPSPAVSAPEPPPSVALRIPIDEPAPVQEVAAEAPAKSPLPPSGPDRSLDKTILKREARLPLISTEFPKGNQIAPPAAVVPLSPQTAVPNASNGNSEREDSGPRVYRIRDGDTLRRIARLYLNWEERWREIYELNRDVIVDPELLPIGKEIKLPAKTPPGVVPTASNAVSEPATPGGSEGPLTDLVPIR